MEYALHVGISDFHALIMSSSKLAKKIDALLVPPPDTRNVITPYMVIQRVLNELCANTNVPSVTDV